jgi:hypothetical protein
VLCCECGQSASGRGLIDDNPSEYGIAAGFVEADLRSLPTLAAQEWAYRKSGAATWRFAQTTFLQRIPEPCGPQKPLRIEICMTPGADSGFFLRLFQRTLFGVLALCEADLPCCRFEVFGSVTSAPSFVVRQN